MEIKYEFTDKDITPWGGLYILKEFLDKMDFDKFLDILPMPKQLSNRGYDPKQIIKAFIISVWCGSSRFEHIEVLRQDEVLREIFGWEKMPGHRAFQRYFKKFSLAINHKVFTELFKGLFDGLRFDNYTLDLDSSVITRYGEQEGATTGYNPKKPGRKSHHPLIAFVSEIKMIANFWLRPGNAYTTDNYKSFLEETLERLSGKKVGLLRADSGFYDDKIFKYLEEREEKIPYVIAAKFYYPTKIKIITQKIWLKVADGIEIADTTLQSNGWEKERRMIIVRQEIEKRPKACGKQIELVDQTIRLFEDENIYKQYRYSCYITNSELPAEHVWNLYRHRAEAENRIKEIKEDYSIDSFNMQEFYATEAALNFAAIAYNIMSLFKQVVMKSNVEHRLKTIRYKILSIGSYFVKRGNQRILRLSLPIKRRQAFIGLWENSCAFLWPVYINNVF